MIEKDVNGRGLRDFCLLDMGPRRHQPNQLESLHGVDRVVSSYDVAKIR